MLGNNTRAQREWLSKLKLYVAIYSSGGLFFLPIDLFPTLFSIYSSFPFQLNPFAPLRFSSLRQRIRSSTSNVANCHRQRLPSRLGGSSTYLPHFFNKENWLLKMPNWLKFKGYFTKIKIYDRIYLLDKQARFPLLHSGAKMQC